MCMHSCHVGHTSRASHTGHVHAPWKLKAHTVISIQCSDQQPRFGKQELVSSSHRTVGLARLHLAINSGSGDMWRILPESPSEKWCKKPGEKKVTENGNNKNLMGGWTRFFFKRQIWYSRCRTECEQCAVLLGGVFHWCNHNGIWLDQ